MQDPVVRLCPDRCGCPAVRSAGVWPNETGARMIRVMKATTLRRRLAGQIALMVTATALVGACAVWGINGLHQDFDTAQRGYAALREAYEIGTDVSVASAHFEAGWPELAAPRLERARARVQLSAEGPWWDGVAAAIDEAVARLAAEQASGVANRRALDPVMGELARFAAQRRVEIEQAAQQVAARRSRTLALVSVLSAGAIALAAVAGMLQYRGVIQPLNRLRTAVRRMRGGALEERVETRGDREFRELAGDFNEMAGRLDSAYRDLEERIARKSRELARSARLASVGYLAAGVAHEINNPLSIIAGYGERSLRHLDRGLDDAAAGRLRQSMQVICEEAFRCKAITSRLLSLSRDEQAQPGEVWLSRVAREVVSALGELSGYRGASLVVEVIADREQPIWADPGEIKQAVLNLVINALQAADGRGGEGRVRVAVDRVGDRMVLLVEDNGTGMTAEVIDRAFEPFFSTARDSGRPGTGLGLSITEAIVREHGGRLTAESDGPDRGSRFTIELPVMKHEGVTG